MSVNNVFYETAPFSPAILTLPQFREPHQELNPQLIQKANEESSVLLKELGAHEVTRTAKSSCLYGLINGVAASFLFKNPLPLLMGLSGCFPRVHAQQKVGNVFQVNTYSVTSQDLSSVAHLNNGNFVVTWSSMAQDGSGVGVYGQLFDKNGVKIKSEFQVNTYTSSHQDASAVASLVDGNFIVTWASYLQDGSSWGVYGQLFEGNGTKIGNEFRVNTYTSNLQSRPSVASFSNGNFVVTWDSFGQDGSGFGIYGQLFEGNSTKIGNEFIVNSDTMGDQRCHSVTSFNNGNFVVIWASEVGVSDYGIYGQLFDKDGFKIGSEFLENTYVLLKSRGCFRGLSVTSLADGNFIMTWESYVQDTTSVNDVFGQLFNGNGAKIGSAFRINSYARFAQSLPSVASFSNGNFIVTWRSENQGIYGQLFEGNGNKIGSEFPVYTEGSNFPSIATLNKGNFVVTWTSGEIFGQIFHDNITYPPITLITRSSNSSTMQTTSSMVSSGSSRTTSTTTTTSSTISSISSSTMQTTSSMASSFSNGTPGTTKSTSSTAHSDKSISANISQATTSTTLSDSSNTMYATSDPSHRFSWVWFLLGVIGGLSCFGLMGYFIRKHRDRTKGDYGSLELGESEQESAQRVKKQYRSPLIT